MNSENQIQLEEVLEQLKAGSMMQPELMEIFREEAEDHLHTIYGGLSALQENNADGNALSDIRRAAHTLKGAAGAVNLQAATRLAHRMEDLLDHLAERNAAVTDEQLTLLLATADQLEGLTSDECEIQSAAEQIVELYSGYANQMREHSAPPRRTQPDRRTENESPSIGSADSAVEQTIVGSSVQTNQQFLRVPLDRLDDLVGLLGEMMVNRSEFQHRLDDFESRIDDMQSAMERLRNVSQFAEDPRLGHHDSGGLGNRSRSTALVHPSQRDGFDSLEFERYTESNLMVQTLSEADNDAEMMSSEFRAVKSALDGLLRRQMQLNREAQKSLMRIRMVPLSGIVSRLERTVRTVAKKLDRQVNLQVSGERIELDKTVLDQIVDPLLHLLRNAIDHGSESPEVRKSLGKPEGAQLNVKAINQGTQMTLLISDDGAGINLEKVRQKAVEKGLVAADQELSNDEIHALIFRPGFSTADQLTDVSGRGVGMDVVGDTIRRLKGTIRVESQKNQGTTFTIQLPTSVGVARAITVESGGKSFAIPMQSVKAIKRLDPRTVTEDSGRYLLNIEDQEMRLLDLGCQLQLSDSQENYSSPAPLLVLENGLDGVALQVDEILGSQDIVVKSLGNHLKNINGIIGATIKGDGSVMPILNTSEIVNRNQSDLLTMIESPKQTSAVPQRNLAMVVDDSISVRRVTENLLKSKGWDSLTAKDGVDALEKLAQLDSPPDIFLCDMEMPRMDGLELIRQIREQDEFDLTPIVMITSRSSEKHRHKAFEAGVTDYVVKPFNDDHLMGLITGLVQTARETVA